MLPLQSLWAQVLGTAGPLGPSAAVHDSEVGEAGGHEALTRIGVWLIGGLSQTL